MTRKIPGGESQVVSKIFCLYHDAMYEEARQVLRDYCESVSCQDKTVYLRDIDGTGSMHVCAKGDPGAVAYVPVNNRTS